MSYIMTIVFDSSTLILLAKTELLRMVVGRSTVLVSSRVRAECLVKDSFDAILIGELMEEGEITVEKVGSDKAAEKLMADFRLARGEAESLCLATMKRCPLAVDDGVAIKACRILDQKFVTAIHFLIQLHATRVLSREAALAKLEKLAWYGRYNQRILDDAARRIQED